MKITSVDVIELKQTFGMQLVAVRVHCDEGIYGLGEIGVAIGDGGYATTKIIAALSRMILGMNPLENDVIWETMYRKNFWAIGGGGFIISAISAIDTAIWDLKGKLLGVSVATLLGGKHRTKLRSYASQIQMGWKDNQSVAPNESPEEFKEACQRVVSMGYTAVKANVIGLNEQKQRRTYQETMSYIEKSVLKRAEQRLAAMRDGVGPDVGIIMENHCITDGNTAIQFARIAEEYDVMLMEEPAVPTNIEVFNKIASYTSIPLATGEHTYLRSGFRPLIESGSVSVLQPDLGNCGGFTEAKKIADHAAQYDIGIQAHVCSGPISHAASLQFEAAIPNFYYHEGHLTNTLPQIIEMGTEDYPTVNGYIEVPDKPGIGMDLSEKALKEANIITIQ